MNHDISELMLSSFSGNENDEFGKDKDVRLPLLLPKVMEGRLIKSTSLLLCRLPPEILGDIMDLIADDKAALSALALVNSDCRQLARSCQFADVCFDYSPNSTLLLFQLMKEGITRLGQDDPSNTTRPPYIGPCIRRVVVKPRPEWVAQAHGDLHDAVFGVGAGDLSPEHRNELSKKATDQYIATYRTPVQVVMKLAMPHLEALLWHDRLCLDGAFFRTVTNLPIRHLRLAGVHIGEIYRLEPPATPLVVPLESLSLRVRLCNNKRSHRSNLAADTDADADADTWGGRSLQALSVCQPFRDLETLVIPYLNGKDTGTVQPMIDFISGHPHVRKLSIGRSTPQLLDSHLVPLLSDGRWSNLSSLSLVWSEPGTVVETQPHIATISAASLAAVGSIESLEQLCLSAGQQFGWRHQWLIDHNAMRLCLRGLAKLKRLAFSRDTYVLPDGASGPGVEGYYERRWVTSAERNDALERPELDGVGDVEHMAEGEGNNDGPEVDSTEVWERAHRNRMLRKAEEYVAVFPHLEWVYCGQWPMEIRNKPTSEGTTRVAMPLAKARDSCWTILERMFAMGKDDQ
ncbi:hypothetical protein C8A00DRAFT_46197 [Chaetomidium leptoderma]|uniref:F-box domain-containing protein n=1 Tax=Chaetomidium leptoderma TaxID=669021 RepID=A0AAN6VF95_9PEZI|nr:hypothetical protein C8A00DRAFT_46197 [Chaetomidium leptoderma]